MTNSIPIIDYRKIKANPMDELELILIERNCRDSNDNPRWVNKLRISKFKNILDVKEFDYLINKYGDLR